ncbi:MAG: hypothetical protein OXG30_14585 [bacterium]|nr:hypothetical protein [bacterium]MCY4136115.1 hypothetical protein [bacterium]
MSRIKAYENPDRGPAWCAEGEMGDFSYYAGADTLEELTTLIAEAAAESGASPEVIVVSDPDADEAPIVSIDLPAIVSQ